MFADKLKSIMKEGKITQSELAKHLNVKQQTVSQYVNDITQPDINTLIKIADFFDMTIDELVDRDKTKDYHSIKKSAIREIKASLDKIDKLIKG
jgi:transcriptional regulator with XRE-family HTH domain